MADMAAEGQAVPGRAQGETPLEAYRARARVTSIAAAIATAVMAIAYGAASADAASRYATMVQYPSLNKVTDTYTSAYQSAQTAAGATLVALGVCSAVAGVAILAWVASNLLIAYKRS